MFSITFQQYLSWYKQWERNKEANPNLRKGQHFCNFFNLTNPRLFYATDKLASEMIKDYING